MDERLMHYRGSALKMLLDLGPATTDCSQLAGFERRFRRLLSSRKATVAMPQISRMYLPPIVEAARG